MAITILLVEDDIADAVLVERTLRNNSLTRHQLIHASSLDEFHACIEKHRVDVILLDLYLGKTRGLETLMAVKQAVPSLPIVVITGLNDNDTAIAAVREGAQDYCIKGSDDSKSLIRVMRYAMERKRAEEDRKRLEGQVQQAQKLESLSVLAAGIAHDFNNLLMSIMGNADLALMEMSPESPSRERIENMVAASMQAADLAKQMLAYSGCGRFVVNRIGLQPLVEEMLHLIKVSISKKIQFECQFAGDVPPIDADAVQIRQIIMNMVINASESMGKKSGQVTLRTGIMDYLGEDIESTYISGKIPDAHYSFFEISDTGCGMDTETIHKIFDPFYTTKFTGRGLGLAAVLGIVHGHQGAIQVRSELGRGTTFRVLFPACHGPTDVLEIPAEASHRDELKGRHVLLVDDEPGVLAVVSDMLSQLGMLVTVASDGLAAVDLFRLAPEKYAHIILDLTMPIMNGEEAFKELRAIREDVSILLSSGYHEEDLVARFEGQKLPGFIQKPYRTESLRCALLKISQEAGA